MEFNIDFDKISKIYGEEVVDELYKEKDEVNKNINYMYMLGFSDVEDIFERETLLFLYDNKTFKEKIDSLIKHLGITFVDDIENDLSLLEELL